MENFKAGDIVWVDKELIGEVMYVDESDDKNPIYQVQVDVSFDDRPTVDKYYQGQLTEFVPQVSQELPF